MKKTMKIQTQKGFTLIEIMIVVAVIAILGAVAYPSYVEQILKGTRTEGKASLMRTTQTLERFFTARGRYPTVPEFSTLFGLAANTSVLSNPDNVTLGKYQLLYVITTPTPQADGGLEYQLTAQILNNGVVDPAQDSVCGHLQLDSRGRRSVSTGTSNTERCWK
jgi:type IV pilus assembly protein PilE